MPDEGRTSNFPFLHVPAASTSRSQEVTDVGCWSLALHTSSLQVCIYFVMENILAVGIHTGPLASDHIGCKNIYIHQLICFCLIFPSWVNGKTISWKPNLVVVGQTDLCPNYAQNAQFSLFQIDNVINRSWNFHTFFVAAAQMWKQKEHVNKAIKCEVLAIL